MKQFLLLLFIGICFTAAAQKTEQYYDYYWKPCQPGQARFYSTLEKTDSGWLRHDYYINNLALQMKALYADESCKILNGSGYWFYANEFPSSSGRWNQGKREGLFLSWHSNGMLADSAYYSNDKRVGPQIGIHRNGFMADSTDRINDSTEIQLSWFDDGGLSHAGYIRNGKMHGKWKFYHRNGTLAGNELFENGKVVSKEYFNEDGTAQPDTAKANKDAEFKNGGNKGWARYLESSTMWPHDVTLVNTTTVTIGVVFVVNEEGKVEDAEVSIPFNALFDERALNIVRKSSIWKPRVVSNRKMKQRFRQAITFVQVE